MKRRGFLKGLLGVSAAPVIAKAAEHLPMSEEVKDIEVLAEKTVDIYKSEPITGILVTASAATIISTTKVRT